MKRKQITVVDAIRNPKLFGSLFPDLASWSAWIVFLKATFGIEMDATELDTFQRCTNRSIPPHQRRSKEAYAIVGRRGGKSRISLLCGNVHRLLPRFQEIPRPRRARHGADSRP